MLPSRGTSTTQDKIYEIENACLNRDLAKAMVLFCRLHIEYSMSPSQQKRLDFIKYNIFPLPNSYKVDFTISELYLPEFNTIMDKYATP